MIHPALDNENILDRIVRGNCFQLMNDLPAESFDMLMTDPPFGTNYRSNRRKKETRFDNMRYDIDLSWFDGWLFQAYRLLKPNRHCLIFAHWSTDHIMKEAIHRFNTYLNHAKLMPFTLKGQIIWYKESHGTGDLHGGLAPTYEEILFLSKGRRIWDRSSLPGHAIFAQRKRPRDFISHPRIQKRLHPTQKPAKLIAKLVEASTNPDEIVLDPFAGSGATALACKLLTPERFYYGIELDPRYLKTIKAL